MINLPQRFRGYPPKYVVPPTTPLTEKMMNQPKFFLETFTQIVDKESRATIPFVFNPSQAKYYRQRSRRDIILKPRQLGFCGHPNTRILTDDLRWVALKDIQVGQQVVATDEFLLKKGKGSARRLRTAVVEKKCRTHQTAYKLIMDDGRELILTGGHRLLSGIRVGAKNVPFKEKYGKVDGCGPVTFWRQVKDFRIGDTVRSIVQPWDACGEEDRWFGGVIDGCSSGITNGRRDIVIRTNGEVFSTILNYVKSNGYHYRVDIISSTDSQVMLYEKVKGLFPSAVMNFKFNRGNGKKYYIDIAIPEYKIAIEFDGDYFHKDDVSDRRRQSEIEKLGWVVCRYSSLPNDESLQRDIGLQSISKTDGYRDNRKKRTISIERISDILRLIGQTRPKKLIGFCWWEGKQFPASGSSWARVVSIEDLPEQEMIDLQTSKKTYIAEGFVSHNSTEIIGEFLHDTMYNSNTVSVLVAQTDKDATDMFSRALFMYDSVDEMFKTHRKHENMKGLSFGLINSTYYIGSAESRGFGRGKTINNLHCTEVSLPIWDRDFLNALIESVPKSGRVVLESTARGEGGLFYEMYFAAKRGEIDFKAHFFRWWEHKEYREPLPIGVSRRDFIESYDYDEKELVKRYTLSPEQMQWRRIKKSRLGVMFVQEYPETEDEDAFLKSGTPIFDSVMLKERDDSLPDQAPAQIWLGGNLYIYRVAYPGGKYVVSCDTSEGDINSDYAAAMVTRHWPLPIEQVALLHGRWSPDIFSEMVYKLARAYNWGQIAVERNNHGHAVLLNLGNGIVRAGVLAYPPYPNIYVGPDKKYGWNTTPLSKPQMIVELDRAIRSGEVVLNSKPFLKEARRFSTLRGGGMGVAKAVGYDDIVMAQAVGIMAIKTGMGSMDFEFI